MSYFSHHWYFTTIFSINILLFAFSISVFLIFLLMLIKINWDIYLHFHFLFIMFVQSFISPFVHSLLFFPFDKHKLNLFYFTSLDKMMTSNIIKNIFFFDESIHQISSIISISSLLSYSQSVNHHHHLIRNVISFLFFLTGVEQKVDRNSKRGQKNIKETKYITLEKEGN